MKYARGAGAAFFFLKVEGLLEKGQHVWLPGHLQDEL
jgi:hypothetical protein